jgi:hypothetical protein
LYGREWDIEEWRIRYIGHIINLIIQAFLFADVIGVEELESYNSQDETIELADKEVIRTKFRLLEPLGQVYNIIIYIRGSPGYIVAFKALVKRLILMDNCTRWNS